MIDRTPVRKASSLTMTWMRNTTTITLKITSTMVKGTIWMIWEEVGVRTQAAVCFIIVVVVNV
jgi:hypothetical protein